MPILGKKPHKIPAAVKQLAILGLFDVILASLLTSGKIAIQKNRGFRSDTN
jgi:hypothetical protein